MARLHFTAGTRFLLKEQIYQVLEVLFEQKVMVENLSFGGKTIFRQEELATAWTAKELVFETFGRNVLKETTRPIATGHTIVDFQGLEGVPYEEAWRRYQLLLPLLKLPEHKRDRKTIMDYAKHLCQKQKVNSQTQESSTPLVPASSNGSEQFEASKSKRSRVGKAISWASLERWLTAFERGNYDIRALVPNMEQQGGKHKQQLNFEVEEIIKAMLGECRLHPTHRTAYDIYLHIVNRVQQENATRPTDPLPLPSRNTVWRRVRAAGSEAILHRSPGHLRLQAQANVETHTRPSRILERVEIDHTVLDFIVVDEEDRLPIGRPTLTFAIDVYSGYPYGFYLGFEPPSYLTVQHCLLMGILPKPDCQTLYGTKNLWPVYGLPETLIVDNGKEFVGRDLADACAQLGIILERMPVKKPWYKGAIERHFRTNNTGLVHLLPGSTMSNILARVDYDPMRDACVSFKALLEVLHTFWLDIDAQKWHEGVGGIPAKMWQESVEAGWLPTLHQNSTEVRILLYRSTERTLRREGIFFQSLRYQHPKLAHLRSKVGSDTQVRVKYDPGDLSAVYVTDSESAGGWLKVPSTEPEYTQHLTLWKHKIVREYVLRRKRQVNIYDLAEAKAHIQQVVSEEFILTRKSKGRKIAARFLGIGTQVEQPTPTTGTSQATVEPPLPSPQPASSVTLTKTSGIKELPEGSVATSSSPESIKSSTTAKSEVAKSRRKSAATQPKPNKVIVEATDQLQRAGQKRANQIKVRSDKQGQGVRKRAGNVSDSSTITTITAASDPNLAFPKTATTAPETQVKVQEDDNILPSGLNGDYDLPI